MQIHLINIKLGQNTNSNLMNLLSASAICVISLTTPTLGLSLVQPMDFAAPRALAATFTVEDEASEKANLRHQESHLLLCAYEPPPDIGGPKRTGGSGGRYV